MRQLHYGRVLLKISGESLKGSSTSGIDPNAVNYLAEQVHEAHSLGVELAIVIGGGNIWRGEAAEEQADETLDESEIEEGDTRPVAQVSLLQQPFIKDNASSVAEMVHELAAKVGENVRVLRFVRLALGD